VNKQFIDQSNKHFPPAAAFKFSPSLNGESSGMSKVEKERRLEELKKVRDSLSLSLNQFAVNKTELPLSSAVFSTLFLFLSETANHRL